VHLSFVTSQRAEYYADRLAAATGGSEEFARALERLLDGDLLEAAVHRVVVARSPRKPLDEFRDLLDSVPARERERRRRAAAEEASSIGFTHPPTGQRIRMIRERPPTAPAIALDRDGLDAIRAELRPEFDRANDRLADLYAAMLYR
jgi:Zn-dependent protease with chaperone function